MTDEDALTDVISLLAISRHRLMAGALDAGARPVHHQGDQVSTYIYLFCRDLSRTFWPTANPVNTSAT